ncbi:hypothetical protein PS647_03774 [Pseudomonas fluorescens]|nr:hypothetical protein PS647_03774 [Pseudomonas fluorescens]
MPTMEILAGITGLLLVLVVGALFGRLDGPGNATIKPIGDRPASGLLAFLCREFIPLPGAEVVSKGWSVYPSTDDEKEGQLNERKTRCLPGGKPAVHQQDVLFLDVLPSTAVSPKQRKQALLDTFYATSQSRQTDSITVGINRLPRQRKRLIALL